MRLNVESSSSRGGDIRLGFTFLDDWTVALGYGFRRERFRLDDDGLNQTQGGRAEGVGEEEAHVANASLAYAFSTTMGIEFYVGTTIDGEFQLDDEDGRKLAKSDYDDAMYGGARFTFGF